MMKVLQNMKIFFQDFKAGKISQLRIPLVVFHPLGLQNSLLDPMTSCINIKLLFD